MYNVVKFIKDGGRCYVRDYTTAEELEKISKNEKYISREIYGPIDKLDDVKILKNYLGGNTNYNQIEMKKINSLLDTKVNENIDKYDYTFLPNELQPMPLDSPEAAKWLSEDHTVTVKIKRSRINEQKKNCQSIVIKHKDWVL